MRKVVFVNHLAEGSASSYRQAGFAKSLRRQGLETVLVGRSGGDGPGDSEAFAKTVGWVEPLELALLQNSRLLARVARDADVIHVNRANPFTSTIVTLARSGTNAAVVADMEDWDGYGGYSSYIGSYGPKGWALTAFERAFPRTADAVVVVSALLYEYMRKAGVPSEKLTVIHNGFDGDLFSGSADGGGARRRYGLAGSPVVIYSSTFWGFEREQHETAFRALRRVFREVPEARGVLTGRGASGLSRALEESGVADRVVIPGFVPRKELPGIMAAADVALHVIGDDVFHCASSPMVVPEYMAMGKPVVAPDVGELKVLLGGGAGVLVDGGDPDSIAEATVGLLRDRERREKVGRRALQKATAEYSYEAEGAELRRTYERALA